ncbi:hypothetical protein [Dyella mobilis]|uniref:Uncharacterized protein n=1 Tax=Dyella mobilis TaxID=1849582 RepID=A0ABS2KDV4_9GAMM|nr:hypothetical protein [Dyella mobilis]MBM7129356.1 hypothetical protein [Dyella mobilis]GLQ98650.1 hypothetical protein GCM10007863_30700 [Dyella mobilis]
MELSAYTLMMVIKAMQREIAHFEEQPRREDVPEELAGDYGEYALDIRRSLSETSHAYEQVKAGEPESLPSAEELMKSDNWG